MQGFYGRYLSIDLGKKKHSFETISDDVYETYLGGKGLASYLLTKFNPPRVNPLAADNPLIFATGPLGGGPIWGSSRYGVFTKSPLTGFLLNPMPAGRPRAIDATGYDSIVIKGHCNKPTVLSVHPEGVEFHEAGELWGKDTYGKMRS